jgi:hypothetical protein
LQDFNEILNLFSWNRKEQILWENCSFGFYQEIYLKIADGKIFGSDNRNCFIFA